MAAELFAGPRKFQWAPTRARNRPRPTALSNRSTGTPPCPHAQTTTPVIPISRNAPPRRLAFSKEHPAHHIPKFRRYAWLRCKIRSGAKGLYLILHSHFCHRVLDLQCDAAEIGERPLGYRSNRTLGHSISKSSAHLSAPIAQERAKRHPG